MENDQVLQELIKKIEERLVEIRCNNGVINTPEKIEDNTDQSSPIPIHDYMLDERYRRVFENICTHNHILTTADLVTAGMYETRNKMTDDRKRGRKVPKHFYQGRFLYFHPKDAIEFLNYLFEKKLYPFENEPESIPESIYVDFERQYDYSPILHEIEKKLSSMPRMMNVSDLIEAKIFRSHSQALYHRTNKNGPSFFVRRGQILYGKGEILDHVLKQIKKGSYRFYLR